MRYERDEAARHVLLLVVMVVLDVDGAVVLQRAHVPRVPLLVVTVATEAAEDAVSDGEFCTLCPSSAGLGTMRGLQPPHAAVVAADVRRTERASPVCACMCCVRAGGP